MFAALTASRADAKKTSVSQPHTGIAEEEVDTFSSLDYSSLISYCKGHLQAVDYRPVAPSCPDLSTVGDNDDQRSYITTAAAAGFVASPITRSFESLTSSTLAARVNSFNADYDRDARIGWKRHYY